MSNKIFCECCRENYSKSSWSGHLKTIKHKTNTNKYEKKEIVVENKKLVNISIVEEDNKKKFILSFE